MRMRYNKKYGFSEISYNPVAEPCHGFELFKLLAKITFFKTYLSLFIAIAYNRSKHPEY